MGKTKTTMAMDEPPISAIMVERAGMTSASRARSEVTIRRTLNQHHVRAARNGGENPRMKTDPNYEEIPYEVLFSMKTDIMQTLIIQRSSGSNQQEYCLETFYIKKTTKGRISIPTTQFCMKLDTRMIEIHIRFVLHSRKKYRRNAFQ